MILISIDMEVKSNPLSFLPLTSTHNMFIQPFGKISKMIKPSSLVTNSISTFNQIKFNHSIEKTTLLSESIALHDGCDYRYFQVRIVAWTVSSDRIVGLMILDDDEAAFEIARMYAEEKKDL